MKYSSSQKLIQSTKYFFNIQYYGIVPKLLHKKGTFYGWGRKKSGLKSIELAEKYGTGYTLLEDGFIRSLDGTTSFSIVEDNIGIYYDATSPSKLENIYNGYDFNINNSLMVASNEAMSLIKKHHISKYNNATNIKDTFFKYDTKPKVLVIAQTADDASLEYGLGNVYSTQEMIDDAITENPNSSVYIKIHPEVLSGKKSSDIKIEEIPKSCILVDEDVNPISLLKHFKKVYTKTSGMGMEALIVGLEVVCYGMPYYAGWGLTIDKQYCDRRIKKLTVQELFAGSYILYTNYYNPYSQKDSNIIDTIQTIVKYRNFTRENEVNLYFFGFSRWKRKYITPFFPALKNNKIIFCPTLKDAQKKGLDAQSKIYIWGKKPFPYLEKYARSKNIPLIRVEDGFVRSVSLGSDLTKAYSLVVDFRGIYFDPTQISDLEHILNTHQFDKDILERSKNLQQYLIANKISKYNNHQNKKIKLIGYHSGQKIIMVPGQVEDDASIIYGANGMTNLELLKRTKNNAPKAYIIYKPHPDVLAGNRKGNIEPKVAKQYCDTIITNVSLDSVLLLCDEVHTMTSLVGFEALIRGKKVYTYGLPFYAGWGQTIDTRKCERRIIKRSLDELVAATLILYPRYIHPKTNMLCEIEVLLKEIEKEKKKYSENIIYHYFVDIRNQISRKIQYVLRFILDQRD